MDRLEAEVARQRKTPLQPHERQATRALIKRMYDRRAIWSAVQKLGAWTVGALGLALVITQLLAYFRPGK